eukprot:4663423-Pleurochrysis_carterae.AAC.7
MPQSSYDGTAPGWPISSDRARGAISSSSCAISRSLSPHAQVGPTSKRPHRCAVDAQSRQTRM